MNWKLMRQEIMEARVTVEHLGRVLEAVNREHLRPREDRTDVFVLSVISFAPGELSPAQGMAIVARLQALARLLKEAGVDEALVSGEMLETAARARLILPKDGRSKTDPRFDAAEFMAMLGVEGRA